MSQNQLLEDVQGRPDTRGIALQKAGVKNVGIPLHVIQKDGQTQRVLANVSMSVGLAASEKGTHMSRFIIQLVESSKSKAFCCDLKSFLADTQERLNAETAYIKMDFQYVVDKPSPVTLMSAPMAYHCSFEASLVGTSTYQFILGVEVPIATLCPCSKAISDYGAHNQRAMVRAKVLLDTMNEHSVFWIEDLIQLLDNCASCPVFPILKREDEKYVTEYAYDNPKFVEDVLRDSIASLREIPSAKGFQLEVEALESIHSHNAWAYQEEGF
jgi:GTP cyclohydrolase IB